MKTVYYSVKNNFYLLLAALLVFIPLYPKFPTANIPGTYVAIRIEDFIILGVCLLWLLFNAGYLKYYLTKTIYQLIILFWVIGGLSLLSGIFITHSVSPLLGLMHYIRRIEYISLFIVAATSVSSINQIRRLFIVFLMTGLLVVSYGFGQIWLDFPVISTTNKEFSKGLVLFLANGARVSSTFAGHYDLAIYLSIILMFAANLFFYYKRLFAKVLIAVIAILSFALLGFTAARVSFIVTIVGLALALWLDKRKLVVGLLLLAAVVSVATIPDLRHRLVATVTVNLLGGGGAKYTPPPGKVTVFTPIKQIPESSRVAFLRQIQSDATKPPVPSKAPSDIAPQEPVNTTELGVYRSLGIRFNVEWPRAINAFLKNPVLGLGYSSITLATDNDVLRSLGEVGILGTISLGLIYFALLKRTTAFMSYPRGLIKYLAISLFSSTCVLLLTGLFIDVFEASKVAEIYWLISGIIWGVLDQGPEKT